MFNYAFQSAASFSSFDFVSMQKQECIPGGIFSPTLVLFEYSHLSYHSLNLLIACLSFINIKILVHPVFKKKRNVLQLRDVLFSSVPLVYLLSYLQFQTVFLFKIQTLDQMK